MSKNSLVVVAIALILLVIGGVAVYQRGISTTDTNVPEATTTVDTVQQQTEDVQSTANTGDTVQSAEEPVAVKGNTDGMHIMADGKVMSKDGKEVTGATIRADGKILLSDGIIVTPAFDLRSTTDTKPTEVTTTKAPTHVVIDVVGIDFEYDIKQIKVKKGDTVTINFKSNKGFHDWVVDEFDAATERVTEKDGITSVTFVADKVGTFQYYCSVMNHRQMGMIGYLIVEEN